MNKNNDKNNTNISLIIELNNYLNSCEKLVNTLIKQRGVSIADKVFNRTMVHVVEGSYPMVCGIIDSLSGGSGTGIKRLRELHENLKKRGF